jgi:hypothetical protein
MVKPGQFQAIVDRMFEDSDFAEALVSPSVDVRREALRSYFGEDNRGLERALDTLNRMVDSPYRDTMREFVHNTDGVRIAG